MKLLQFMSLSGLILLVNIVASHEAFSQSFRGMENANFHARGPATMPPQSQFSPQFSQQTFQAESRAFTPAAASPASQPAVMQLNQPAVSDFQPVAAVGRVAGSVQPVAAAAVQTVTTTALPAASLTLPATVQSSQSLTGSLLVLPGGKPIGSSTAIQTDTTPRPIVRLPAAGPASTVYLKTDEAAGYTFVVTSSKYAISLVDYPGSYIQGESGTAFSVTRSGNLVIKEGVALVGAGREALTVNTRLAEITIAPDGIALIETGQFGPCRVTTLRSTDKGIALSVTRSDESKATFAVPESTELIVADHQLTPEELISTDGVDREYRRVLLDSADWHVVRSGLPVANLIRRHPLLIAATSDKQLSQTQVIKTLLHQYHERLQEPMPATQKQATADDTFLGISYNEQSALPGLRSARQATVNATGKGHYMLKRGTIFLESADALRVDTPSASVLAAPHTVVVISADDTRTQVLNLHDRRTGDVKLLVGKIYVPLGPGKEARVLKEQSFKARPLALGDGIGRRSMRVIQAAENLNVVVNEFSIPDALLAHPVLKQFSASQDAPDRSLVNKIVKTAAAVAFATAGSREAYSSAAVR